MTSQFIQQFIQYETLVPNRSIYTIQEVKKNFKLLLQLATMSQLKLKTEKNGRVKFFCKKHGRKCFLIRVTKTFEYSDSPSRNQQPCYMIEDDFNTMLHANNCQFQGEQAMYFKTYCLMHLKKRVIQDFMVKKHLMKKEPSQILYLFSNQGIKRGIQQPQRPRYFYQRFIQTHQFRKNLKKKFDNIVNIDIKAKQKKQKVKIEEPFSQLSQQDFNFFQNPRESIKCENKETLIFQFTRNKTQQKSKLNIESLKLQSSQNKVMKEESKAILFQQEQPQKNINRRFVYTQNQHFPFKFSQMYDQRKQQNNQRFFDGQQLKQIKQKNKHKNSIGIDSFENAYLVSKKHFDIESIESHNWDSLENLIGEEIN